MNQAAFCLDIADRGNAGVGLREYRSDAGRARPALGMQSGRLEERDQPATLPQDAHARVACTRLPPSARRILAAECCRRYADGGARCGQGGRQRAATVDRDQA